MACRPSRDLYGRRLHRHLLGAVPAVSKHYSKLDSKGSLGPQFAHLVQRTPATALRIHSSSSRIDLASYMSLKSYVRLS